ncbi:MAG: glycosyltransferase family 2 protein [Gammaproteobacteria bacterium]|nr:glycosyltransferase family 2 protein [Gammaproteobacteria bacterium]
MKDASIRFTIAIIHRNGLGRLKRVLNSAIDNINDFDEILIIDNSSTDGSIEEIEQNGVYKNIRVIKNPCNTGYAYPCNQAMKMGSGKYFLLCNNDIELPKNCLDDFERVFVNFPKAGIIGGQLLDLNQNKVGSYSGNPTFLSELDSIGRLTSPKKFQTIHEVDTLRGACLAVRRLTVESAGMMDDDFFFYFEETEWCMRIAKAGWKLLIAPHINITHAGGDSTKSVYYGSRIEFFRSRLLFWHKIFPMHLVIILYLWNIPKLIIDGCFYLIITILTFGLNIRMRNKLTDRVAVLTWLLLGKPKKWGLPGKC